MEEVLGQVCPCPVTESSVRAVSVFALPTRLRTLRGRTELVGVVGNRVHPESPFGGGLGVPVCPRLVIVVGVVAWLVEVLGEVCSSPVTESAVRAVSVFRH